MDPNILTEIASGLGMAGGIWALVRWSNERRANGNGHSSSSGPVVEENPMASHLVNLTGQLQESALRMTKLTEQVGQLVESRAPEPEEIFSRRTIQEIAESLKELPGRFEKSLEYVALSMEEATDRQLKAPPPVWTTEVADGLTQSVVRLERLAGQLSEPPAASLERVTDRLEALIQMGPPPLPAELASLPDQVAKKQKEASREMLVAAKSGQSVTPPRTPRTAPQARAIPSPLPPIPHIPPPYVGGTIVVPAGQPVNLLLLIQQQLQPNCPGTCVQFRLSADAEMFVGAASFYGGPLTSDNYAYVLEPGEKRIYQSTYPGSSTPIGDLQVLGSGALHVEVQL